MKIEKEREKNKKKSIVTKPSGIKLHEEETLVIANQKHQGS